MKSIWNRKLRCVCLVSLPNLGWLLPVLLAAISNVALGGQRCFSFVGPALCMTSWGSTKGEAGRQWCHCCPGSSWHVWTHPCSWVFGCSQGKGKKLLIHNRKPVPLSFPSLTAHRWSSLNSGFPDSGNTGRQRCFLRWFREGKKLQKSLKYYLPAAKKLLFLFSSPSLTRSFEAGQEAINSQLCRYLEQSLDWKVVKDTKFVHSLNWCKLLWFQWSHWGNAEVQQIRI